MVATTTSMSGFSRDTSARTGKDEILLVFYDERGALVHPLADGEKIIVGREEPAKVVLTDRSLSRQHASFRRNNKAVLITDLESRNGTYLRGERINAAWVEAGDELFLARVLVTVVEPNGPGGKTDGLEIFQALGRAYDDTQTGFVALDNDAQQLWSNPSFEALLKRNDGIAEFGRQIRFADDPAQRALTRALEAHRAGKLSTGSQELVCVQRSSSPRPYVVAIFSIASAAPLVESSNPFQSGVTAPMPDARLCLTVIDPDRSIRASAELLRKVYGITPAEARVANSLAQGLRVQDIAEQNGVSATTVRNQLKSLFVKTQTSSQSDLVRVVMMTAGATHRRS